MKVQTTIRISNRLVLLLLLLPLVITKKTSIQNISFLSNDRAMGISHHTTQSRMTSKILRRSVQHNYCNIISVQNLTRREPN